ncbi:tetratricopeptide repeat protein [uncultured Serinicoccus sp.]|uniref:tetratricopeptide repeat protein n=1 Tax=uncultured Serinicoccus sp. TaxID=735514 RepID=UPI0026270428|nr:tetratricopeptide repeat protein [uncultured Serinicoccus sp.]
MPTPSAQDRYIIAARLKGYLQKPHDAIALLTTALEESPDDTRLLRFRGHRLISVRNFDQAITDLRAAAAQLPDVPDEFELYQKDVEPDAIALILGETDLQDHHPSVESMEGRPEASRYMTTLHSAVWYHLGVALYLDGQLTQAIEPFQKAYETARHYESKVASLDWGYMILRRLRRDEESDQLLALFAGLADEYDVQAAGYHERMELYSGRRSGDELREAILNDPIQVATVGYGLGNWYLYNGERDKAQTVLDEVLSSGAPHAFAYLAAQSEQERRGELAAAYA